MSVAIPSLPNALSATKADLREVLNYFQREVMAALACAQSGTIQAFYAGPPQTADVALNEEIVIGYANKGSQTSPITKAYPLLAKTPIIVLGGGDGAITFPIAAGDSCLVVFLDRDQDNWQLSGQTNLPPNTPRLHDLSDAVAIVGLRCAKNGLASYSTTDAQFYGPDGVSGPRISLGGGKVEIANSGNDINTLLATTLVAALTALNAKTGPDASSEITAFGTAVSALFKT